MGCISVALKQLLGPRHSLLYPLTLCKGTRAQSLLALPSYSVQCFLLISAPSLFSLILLLSLHPPIFPLRSASVCWTRSCVRLGSTSDLGCPSHSELLHIHSERVEKDATKILRLLSLSHLPVDSSTSPAWLLWNICSDTSSCGWQRKVKAA